MGSSHLSFVGPRAPSHDVDFVVILERTTAPRSEKVADLARGRWDSDEDGGQAGDGDGAARRTYGPEMRLESRTRSSQ